ncbi:MAG: MlaD family protein [bacterium]
MAWQRGKRDLTSLRVGAAVLIGLTVLIFGTLWGQDLLRSRGTYSLTVLFESGFGLKAGDPVLVAGVKKGQVTGITLTGDNRVAVEMRIDEDVRFSREDQFMIESEGIIGSRYINVISGGEGQVLAENDTTTGVNAAGLNDIFRSVHSLMEEIGDLSSDMRSVINDEDLKSQLKETYDNFNRTIDLLNQAMVDNQDLIKDSLDRLGSVVDNVNRALVANSDDLEAALKSLKTAGDEFTQVAGTVDSLAFELLTVTGRVGEGEGTLWKLAESDSIYHQLSGTITRLDSLITDIKNNPKRYLTIRIF